MLAYHGWKWECGHHTVVGRSIGLSLVFCTSFCLFQLVSSDIEKQIVNILQLYHRNEHMKIMVGDWIVRNGWRKCTSMLF